MRTDFAKLMHQGKTTQNCPITNMYMARKCGVVNQNTVITKHAIVTNMHICHQQIVVADGGFMAILNGAAMDGDALTNNIVITDYQTSRFAFVFQVRRVLTYCGKLKNLIVLANDCRAFDHDMRGDHRARTNLYIRSDNRPGANLNIRCQLG